MGVSLGAYHAVNFAFKRADLFPLALGLSGNYDPAAWSAWGDRGTATYFNNPMDYVAHLHGDHLDWLRGRLSRPARLRPGPVGGHHRRARQLPAPRGPARGEGDPPRARPVGPRRAARLALLARAARPPPAADLLREAAVVSATMVRTLRVLPLLLPNAPSHQRSERGGIVPSPEPHDAHSSPQPLAGGPHEPRPAARAAQGSRRPARAAARVRRARTDPPRGPLAARRRGHRHDAAGDAPGRGAAGGRAPAAGQPPRRSAPAAPAPRPRPSPPT